MRPTDVYTSGDDASAAPSSDSTLTYHTGATTNCSEFSGTDTGSGHSNATFGRTTTP